MFKHRGQRRRALTVHAAEKSSASSSHSLLTRQTRFLSGENSQISPRASFNDESLQNLSKNFPAEGWIERHRSRWVKSGSSCFLSSSQEQCPIEDVYQPEDHLESVGSLCVGDRAGYLQHRLGCGGHKSGTARPEDAARGCVSAVERDVCMFKFCVLFLF